MRFEERLRRALRDVAGDAPSIDTVTVGARVRSRVRPVAIAVAATLVAVAVPLGVVWLTRSGESPTPPVASTTLPSEDASTPAVSPSEATPTQGTFPDTLGDCGAGVPAPAVEGGSTPSGKVVRVTAEGVAVYTIGTDTSRIVVPGRMWGYGAAPTLRSANQVTYDRLRVEPDDRHMFGQLSLWETDLVSGADQEILRLPNWLLAHSWDPTGRYLVYSVARQGPKAQLPSIVCRYDSADGSVALLTDMAKFRPSTDYDRTSEESVAWSPDGGAVAVVDRFAAPSLRVISPDGADLVSPRAGSLARWLPDGRLLYLQYWDEEGLAAGWYLLDVRTGDVTSVDLPLGAARPAVSPDGTAVAYDDDDPKRPNAWVFDLSTGETTHLGIDLVAPLWLSSTEVALTETTDCPPRTLCPPGWHATERTEGLSLAGLPARPLRLLTTLGPDLYAL